MYRSHLAWSYRRPRPGPRRPGRPGRGRGRRPAGDVRCGTGLPSRTRRAVVRDRLRPRRAGGPGRRRARACRPRRRSEADRRWPCCARPSRWATATPTPTAPRRPSTRSAAGRTSRSCSPSWRPRSGRKRGQETDKPDRRQIRIAVPRGELETPTLFRSDASTLSHAECEYRETASRFRL